MVTLKIDISSKVRQYEAHGFPCALFPQLILISFLCSLLLPFDLTHWQTLEPSRLFLLRQELITVTYV